MNSIFAKQSLLIVLAVSIALTGYSQKIDTNRIIRLSDSIIINHVGEHTFRNYFKFKAVAVFKDAIHNAVWYQFNLEIFNNSPYYAALLFDDNYVYSNTLNFSFVPSYLIHNQSCNFISRQKAKIILEYISKNSFKKKDIRFGYDDNRLCYAWAIYSFPKEKDNFQEISIDAVSGEVLHNKAN